MITVVHTDSKDSGTASSEDGDRSTHHRLDIVDRPVGGGTADTGSEWSESRPDSEPDSPECLYDQRPPPHLLHPAYHGHLHPSSRLHSPSSPTLHHQTESSSPITKPRIWSLADMATKENDVRTSISSSSVYSGSKIVSSLAGRGSIPHPVNYARQHQEFYRNLYAPHLAGDILESYSRTFGASLNNNGNSTPPFTSVAAAAVIAAATAAATSSSSLTVPFNLAMTAASASSTSSTESSPSESTPSLNLSSSIKSEQRA